MKSNYKKLGDYIQQVTIKNKDCKITNLLGVSIKKTFIPSIANTVGTDFSTYNIINAQQFAYGPVTSRNGDKISISYLENGVGIVSSSYTVFEITQPNILLPEYLMLWFMRAEFDRYARFKSHGSVREIFDWDELCNVYLPVPPIEQQKKIVQTYNSLTKRIELKKQINEKLEEIAQAVYKQWFEDFEFPISEKYAKLIHRPDLIGKPYKSSGGEMIYSEELDKYIPIGWEIKNLDNIIEFHDCKRVPLSSVERAGMEKNIHIMELHL